MNQPGNQRWLRRFAVLTALATLALIGIGGLVTSHEAGMSVPDWPNSYGYNMFLFPPSKWIGGILYEHTHRLWASMVGLLIIALTRWLGGRQSRKPLAIVGLVEVLAGIAIFAVLPKEKATGGFLTGIGGMVLLAALLGIRSGRTVRVPLAVVGVLAALAGVVMRIVLPNPQANGGIGLVALGGYLVLAAVVKFEDAPAARPLPQLGWITFFIVQFQGLLGGLRVVLYKDQIGIFHATLAQIFFVLTCVIALMTSAWWTRMADTQPATRNPQTPLIPSLSNLQKVIVATTALILFQLILGATMRHQHAGLSIRDFPLAYGKLWPATDPASIAHYNAHRIEATAINPVTAFQIQLQMVHRVVAVLILFAVGWCAWKSWRKFSGPLAKISAFWFALILCQATLGAATILTDKAADVATLHVLVGALSLATGAALSIIALRFPQSAVGVLPTEAALKQQPPMDLDEAAGFGTAGKMPAAH